MLPPKAGKEFVTSTHDNNIINISFVFISADDFKRPVYTAILSALFHFGYLMIDYSRKKSQIVYPYRGHYKKMLTIEFQ